MKVVSDRQERDADEKKLKETELLRIKVNKEDVDLVVSPSPQGDISSHTITTDTSTSSDTIVSSYAIPWI